MLEKAERVDAEEDERYGMGKRGDELPEELLDPRRRMQRIAEAYARLEEAEYLEKEKQEKKLQEREQEEKESGKKKRGCKPKDPKDFVGREKKANRTNSDGWILKTRRGWMQGYNVQAMVHCESQLIVAADVTQEENDVKQLGPICQQQVRAATAPDVGRRWVLERGQGQAGGRADRAVLYHHQGLEATPGAPGPAGGSPRPPLSRSRGTRIC